MPYSAKKGAKKAHRCQQFNVFCRTTIGIEMDADTSRDNTEWFDVLLGHLSGGTSIQNIIHWTQLMKAGKPQRFDYGKDENLKLYGSETPPTYDYQLISHPVYLLHGNTDRLASTKDVKLLANSLKDGLCPKLWKKEYEYGHATFLMPRFPVYLDDVKDILDGKHEHEFPNDESDNFVKE